MNYIYDEYTITRTKEFYSHEFGHYYFDRRETKEVARGTFKQLKGLYEEYKKNDVRAREGNKDYHSFSSLSFSEYIKKHNNNTDFYCSKIAWDLSGEYGYCITHVIPTAKIKDTLRLLVNQCKVAMPKYAIDNEEYKNISFINYTKFKELVNETYPGYKVIALGDVYNYDSSFDTEDNIKIKQYETGKCSTEIIVIGIYKNNK